MCLILRFFKFVKNLVQEIGFKVLGFFKSCSNLLLRPHKIKSQTFVDEYILPIKIFIQSLFSTGIEYCNVIFSFLFEALSCFLFETKSFILNKWRFSFGVSWNNFCRFLIPNLFLEYRVEIKKWDCDYIAENFRDKDGLCCAFRCNNKYLKRDYSLPRHYFHNDELTYNAFQKCMEKGIFFSILKYSIFISLFVFIFLFLIVTLQELPTFWENIKRDITNFKNMLRHRIYCRKIRRELSMSYLGQGEIPVLIMDMAGIHE